MSNTLTLPAVTSLPVGAAASPFFSDVRVFNTSYTTSANVTAVYRCFLGSCPASAPQITFTLAPRESRAFVVVPLMIVGLGIGLFTSHLAPLFVRSTPASHLTRLQSLLSLAQTVPLIGSTNLLATLPVRHALALAAATTALAGVGLLRGYRVNSISKVG